MVELNEKFNAIVDTSENFRTKVLLENEEEILKKGKFDIKLIHHIEDQVFEDDLRRQLILSKLALKDGVSISQLAKELNFEDFDIYLHLLHLESEGKVENISNKGELVFKTRLSEIAEGELLRLSLLPPTDIAVGQSVQNILTTRLCTFCGKCISICPVNALSVTDDGPILDEDVCIHCSLCFENCPRTFLPIGLLKGFILGKIIKPDHLKEEPIGPYKKCVMAQCTNDAIKTVKQDGGVVTSIVAYLLEKGEIDGAVVVGLEDDPWKPKPRIVRNITELLKCAGTKYAMSPSLSILDTVRPECDRVCIVGTPCMLQALRKYQVFYEDAFKDIFGEIVAVFGLFCMESFPYEGLKKIAEKGGIQLSDVKKTDINKGKFFLHMSEGDPIELPIAEVAEFAREACHYCVDLTSELADISVGSIGAGSGWSTTIIRTNTGEKIFENAVKDGYLKINEKPINIELVEKLSKRKRNRNTKAVIKKYQKSRDLPPHYLNSIKELAPKKKVTER